MSEAGESELQSISELSTSAMRRARRGEANRRRIPKKLRVDPPSRARRGKRYREIQSVVHNGMLYVTHV